MMAKEKPPITVVGDVGGRIAIIVVRPCAYMWMILSHDNLNLIPQSKTQDLIKHVHHEDSMRSGFKDQYKISQQGQVFPVIFFQSNHVHISRAASFSEMCKFSFKIK